MSTAELTPKSGTSFDIRSRPLPCLALAALVATLAMQGAEERVGPDWNQFRGPHRDGIVHGFPESSSWPAPLEMAWSVPVGAGYASPIASGGRIYVHTRQEQREAVSALDFGTGETLWSDDYPAPTTKTEFYAQTEGEGPYATPVLHEGNLYTLGVHGVASAYDADAGALLWRRDFSDLIVETQRFCGVASSPLVVGERLVVQIGDDDSSELLALSLDNGETEWSLAGPATGNASPNLVWIDDVPQIITMTDLAVIGVGVDDGNLLWEHPFAAVAGSCSTNIPTPAVQGNSLFVSGAAEGTVAIEVTRSGDRWTTHTVWKNDQIKPLWSNLVAEGGELFGVSQQRSGQLFALDASTGEVLWSTEGRSGENGTVLLAGELVFFLMNEAELRIARRTRPGLQLIATYSVADTTVWAYPIVRDDGILVKAGSTLALWLLE